MSRRAYTGCYKLHVYTAEQNEWLKAQHGKNHTTTAIRDDFNSRFKADLSVVQIRRKLKAMDIAFSSRNPRSKGFMATHYTKAGAAHPRERPLGTIRQGRDGLEIKVSDRKGGGRKNWKPLAKHIYETTRQVKTAADEMILHIDGNQSNNQPDNLILVKRRDIGTINKILNLPENRNTCPKVRLSLILMARITQTRQAKTGEQTASMRHAAKKRRQKEQEAHEQAQRKEQHG